MQRMSILFLQRSGGNIIYIMMRLQLTSIAYSEIGREQLHTGVQEVGAGRVHCRQQTAFLEKSYHGKRRRSARPNRASEEVYLNSCTYILLLCTRMARMGCSRN